MPILTDWQCCCGQHIGVILPDGRLQIGAAVIESAVYRCEACGRRKVWRRHDGKLKRLIERMTDCREQVQVLVVDNAADL